MFFRRLLRTSTSSRTVDRVFRMEFIAPFVRSCLRNVDWVASQKVRRVEQWLRFYSQIWSKEKLGQILQAVGKKFFRRRFFLAGTALGVKPPPVESEEDHLKQKMIPDSLITSHAQDLEYAHELTVTTLTCPNCQKRHFIDQKVEGIEYCDCEKRLSSAYGISSESAAGGEAAWSPFLERKDVIVWRRELEDHRGLYAYKMYGRFDDVTAKEFLEVQMDVSDFRLSWDNSTAQCHIISEQEPQDSESVAQKGQVVVSDVNQLYYWEVAWPRFFSNRDYVCARRAVVVDSQDPEDRCIVIYTKSAEHPAYPEKAKTFRVTNYVSVITIKPFTTLDENGVEFSLTAFENPGISLPSSITTWVAIRGMPEFMVNLRRACLERRTWRKRRPCSDHMPSKEPSYMETPPQKLHHAYA